MAYAESFDVSYMVYINTSVNIREESSNDRIKNNELGVELRKIKIKLGSFMLFASLYQEWQDYKVTSNMQRDQNDWKFSRLRVT
jgi:predicted permease